MGAAPRIVEQADITPEQARDGEREWFLDTDTGELKPEEADGRTSESRSAPVRVARWIFD